MGHLGTLVVFPINPDVTATQTDEPDLKITFHESKATVACWSYLGKYLICGHENGSVSQYDAEVCIYRKFPRFS